MSIIRCSVPEGTRPEEFAAFPGSDHAHEQGCTCPLVQPWPGAVDLDSECPLHELQRVAS